MQFNARLSQPPFQPQSAMPPHAGLRFAVTHQAMPTHADSLLCATLRQALTRRSARAHAQNYQSGRPCIGQEEGGLALWEEVVRAPRWSRQQVRHVTACCCLRVSPWPHGILHGVACMLPCETPGHQAPQPSMPAVAKRLLHARAGVGAVAPAQPRAAQAAGRSDRGGAQGAVASPPCVGRGCRGGARACASPVRRQRGQGLCRRRAAWDLLTAGELVEQLAVNTRCHSAVMTVHIQVWLDTPYHPEQNLGGLLWQEGQRTH
jgi:hypothetical protein